MTQNILDFQQQIGELVATRSVVNDEQNRQVGDEQQSQHESARGTEFAEGIGNNSALNSCKCIFILLI